MGVYANTIPTFQRGLTNLRSWLDEAEQNATEREYDVSVLLTARLSPDQFDLTRQIQTACDAAKLTAARLAQVDAPKHEDGPATVEELRTRIDSVLAFIDGLDTAAIDASAERKLAPAFLQGMAMTVPNYLNQFAVPNFYFHLTTSYAILRHNGVKLGKRAFLGSIDLIPAE